MIRTIWNRSAKPWKKIIRMREKGSWLSFEASGGSERVVRIKRVCFLFEFTVFNFIFANNQSATSARTRPEVGIGGIRPPPTKRIRVLQDTNVVVDRSTTLSIDSEKLLHPLEREAIRYFGRPGLQEVFAKLVDDQNGERLFNISLVGPPGGGKSNLVFAAAEYIAFYKGQTVLWVGRRYNQESLTVKIFQPKNDQTDGQLLEQEKDFRVVVGRDFKASICKRCPGSCR